MKILSFIHFNGHAKSLIANVITSLLLIYFIFHSIYGNKGIIAYFKLSQQLEKTYSDLETLRAKRVEIEHKVKLLRPESLNQDMLDEKARQVLGLASPKEQVFTVKKNEINKP
jgi:cell division protein FtsB